ncbi:MAG: hypothetical protein ACP5MG_07700 [Verrucomicrobiia bacterium]
MNRRVFIYLGIGIFAIVLLLSIRFIVRVHNNLVTLNVRNAELREVLKEIEWQTWEVIYVHKSVGGKITLNVKDMPLEEVMEKIAEQTFSRFNVLYPVYKNEKSIANLKKLIRGEITAQESGWTNFYTRPFRFPGAMAISYRDGINMRQMNISISGKDVDLAALALSRYEPARVVIEDGITGKVNILIMKSPFEKAVDKLASQLGLKWTKLYVLQPTTGMGPRFARMDQSQNAQSDTNLPSQVPPPFVAFNDLRFGSNGFLTNSPGDTNATSAMSNAMALARQEFQRQMERQMEILSPQERQQMEEMRQRFEQIRQLPPEQRRAQFEQLANDPEFRQRMQQRILERMYSAIQDLTPEQRAEREREMRQMRQRFGGGPPR